jgi:ABC-type transport system involved in multi-copper enzyme maturation permease subunit
MKGWFTSLHGAITLSGMALLTELWRAFLDFQHEYSIFLSSTGAVLLGTLLYTALFGGWAWALMRALRGSRRALIAALLINLLFLLVLPVGALVAYCPSPCPELWPLFDLANWLNLLLGLLAAVVLMWQLRSKKVAG